jgi:hypothetical protein
MENLVNLIPLFGVLGLLYMAYLYNWVSKQDAGDAKMKSISDAIAEGAMSFLKAEYRVLSIFVIIAGILLGLLSTQVETTHWFIVIAFYSDSFAGIDITHFGSAIWSYTCRRTGAIFWLTRPATIMRSDCLGLARNTSAPKRLMSYRAAAACIISTAQQAKPKVIGQTDPVLAQFTTES